MNILIAVHHFPPDYQEGAEQRAWRTAKALMSRGHHVWTMCVDKIDADPQLGLTWRDETHDGVPVRRLSFNLAAAPDRARFEYDNTWIGEHLRGYLQALNEQGSPIDVLHLISGYLMTGSTLRVAQDMGIATVLSLTDFWFLCPRIQMLRSDGTRSSLPIDPVRCARCLGEQQRRYLLPAKLLPAWAVQAFWKTQKPQIQHIEQRATFLRETLNRVQAIISPSQFLRQMFVDAGVQPERIVYSRQGRDFAHLSPADVQKTPTDPFTLRLGYLGKVTQLKGVHVAVEAMKHLEGLPVTLQIYGNISQDLDYVARLREAISHDPRITIEGPYKPKDLSRVMKSLDATIVPSVWYENSPNVILEAQAHRTPVLASNLGGMAELVRHEQNGLCFTVEDGADLARQIQRLLDEPALLDKLRAGIEPVKSVAQEIDELEAAYRRVRRTQPTQPQPESHIPQATVA